MTRREVRAERESAPDASDATTGNNGAAKRGDDSDAEQERGASTGNDLEELWEFVRGLPRVAQEGFKSHPGAVLAGVGATTFVLGALCGSKVGRLLVTAVLRYGVTHLVEGPLAREALRYVSHVAKQTAKTSSSP